MTHWRKGEREVANAKLGEAIQVDEGVRADKVPSYEDKAEWNQARREAEELIGYSGELVTPATKSSS